MSTDKLSISLDPELAEHVRESARRAGKGVSAWLAEAAAAKLRAEALDEFLEEWKREHGDFTIEELRQAEMEFRHGATAVTD